MNITRRNKLELMTGAFFVLNIAAVTMPYVELVCIAVVVVGADIAVRWRDDISSNLDNNVRRP